MPGPTRLALLSVPQAFGMDTLHATFKQMHAQSFGDPAYWRAMMGTAGLPGMQPPMGGPYAPQHMGANPVPVQGSPDLGPEADPDVWRQQMANAGAPGLENEATRPFETQGQHAADFAGGLTQALNQNIEYLTAHRSPADAAPGPGATPGRMAGGY